MKRKYWILLRVSFIAIVLFGAGSPIGWFGNSLSAAAAVQAQFHTGILVVTGTGAKDEIVVSADPSTGDLVVTDHGVIVPIDVISGTANRALTNLVVVLGGDGNDSIFLEKSLNNGASPTLGPTPNATLIGGTGDDILISDFGGFNGAIVNGKVLGSILGNVVMDGGDGNDTLISGFGNDVMIGGNGKDTLRWRPGALDDSFDGGEGVDTAEFLGNDNNQGDAFVVGIDPNQPDQALVQRTNLVLLSTAVRNIEDIAISTQSGNDTVTITDLTGTAVNRVIVYGGVGNDTINGIATNADLALNGGDGNDVLLGGAGSDTITGGLGSDLITGGAGPDTIIANDGQVDVINCGDGKDRVFIDPPPLDFVNQNCEVVSLP